MNEKINRRNFLSSVTAVGATSLMAASNAQAKENLQLTQKRFKDKVVIITGATSGIGKTGAEMFAKEGAKVFFNGRRSDKGLAVEKEIRAQGGEATFFKCDVSDPLQVQNFFKAAIKKYGRIDIAYNNAAIAQGRKLLHETSLEDWQKIHDINLTGVFLCMKYEIEQMLKQESKGTIVNACSTTGHSGFARLPGYTSSKHAVAGLTRDAGVGYAKDGIRINAISPSDVKTPMQGNDEARIREEEALHPMGRFAEPEEIIKAVMFLSSDDASYFQGETLLITGGRLTI